MHIHIYAYTMLRYAKPLAKGTLGINLFILKKKKKLQKEWTTDAQHHLDNFKKV